MAMLCDSIQSISPGNGNYIIGNCVIVVGSSQVKSQRGVFSQSAHGLWIDVIQLTQYNRECPSENGYQTHVPDLKRDRHV